MGEGPEPLDQSDPLYDLLSPSFAGETPLTRRSPSVDARSDETALVVSIPWATDFLAAAVSEDCGAGCSTLGSANLYLTTLP
jgi:hypothetical protein